MGGFSAVQATGAAAVAQPVHAKLDGAERLPTVTPIKHLVVLFQENVPFDHYFGTYPHALNPPGEPKFVPAPGTPTVNGYTDALLTHNPNLANPKRLDRTDGNVCGPTTVTDPSSRRSIMV